VLAKAVAWAITSLHDTLQSQGIDRPYGLSIILFTLIVKTVLFPLNYQQIKSTTQMQAIQPKVAAIRAKYGSEPADPNAMNNEIASLYQEENLNPLAGAPAAPPPRASAPSALPALSPSPSPPGQPALPAT
jgi:membrane protein insertase Oxa1/YidC/SpoIIIJ